MKQFSIWRKPSMRQKILKTLSMTLNCHCIQTLSNRVRAAFCSKHQMRTTSRLSVFLSVDLSIMMENGPFRHCSTTGLVAAVDKHHFMICMVFVHFAISLSMNIWRAMVTQRCGQVVLCDKVRKRYHCFGRWIRGVGCLQLEKAGHLGTFQLSLMHLRFEVFVYIINTGHSHFYVAITYGAPCMVASKLAGRYNALELTIPRRLESSGILLALLHWRLHIAKICMWCEFRVAFPRFLSGKKNSAPWDRLSLVHMYPLGGSSHPNEYNKMAVFRSTKR